MGHHSVPAPGVSRPFSSHWISTWTGGPGRAGPLETWRPEALEQVEFQVRSPTPSVGVLCTPTSPEKELVLEQAEGSGRLFQPLPPGPVLNDHACSETRGMVATSWSRFPPREDTSRRQPCKPEGPSPHTLSRHLDLGLWSQQNREEGAGG